MIRDPHYNAILQRLADGPDPDTFEHCAQDLLRSIYPKLTPVEGGRDFGMDGLDASHPEQPMILAATTGQDVKRNLVESLRSHRRQGANIGARHVVVATTQSATATLIDDLRGAATDVGFQLVSVRGRRAFADLLYRSSHWTRELLGLSGTPLALSAIPVSSRPMNSLPLVGRDADRQWLADSSGDIVVSGHPASGKTHLLRQFVDQGWLFMVDSDRERVANAVRDSQPDAIIVDDAHTDLNSLGSLQQLRAAIGAEFRIVAVTWPGDIDGVASTLAVSKDSVLTLQPLSRDEILAIVKASGIAGPVELQRTIVNQSDGRPGLTATLCDVAWRGDLHPLLSGELLLRDIRRALTRVGDSDGMQVLAVMALAGNHGASLYDVAKVLSLDMAKSQRSLARLGHIGVFRARFLADKVTVWPLELRFAAVGDAFFSDQFYQNLLLAPAMQHLDESGVAGSLVGAALMGAHIPSVIIEPILLRSGSADDFEGYAAVGEQQAVFALNARPGWLTEIAPHSLLTSPVKTLQMLLERAVGDQRRQNSQTDHPLRIIRDWIERAPDAENAQLERRKLLASVTAGYAESVGDPQVVLEALCRSIDPKYEPVSTDAGSGQKITIGFGLVSRQCLHGLIELWPCVLKAIPSDGPRDYSVLVGVLGDWAYHGFRPKEPPDDIQELMRSHAVNMTADLTKKFSGHPGVLASISEFARRADIGVDIPVPGVYEILFPQEDHSIFAKDGMKGVDRQGRIWGEKARNLARDLEPLGPERALAVVQEASKRAAEVKKTWPDLTGEFAAEITRLTNDPYTWAEQAIDGGMSADFVTPLLRAARTKDRSRTLPLVLCTLKSETASGAAVCIVLSAEEPLEEELNAALEIVHFFPNVVGGYLIPNQAPNRTIRLLLNHPNPAVAEATAVDLWIHEKDTLVPRGLFDAWRAAMLRAPAKHGMISVVFASESWLFAEWIVGFLISNDSRNMYRTEHEFKDAFKQLSTEQRTDILVAIQNAGIACRPSVMARIVGDDASVFRRLLAMEELASLHAAGLAYGVSEEKIKAACDAGWECQRIVEAITSPIGIVRTWSGDESDFWRGRRDEFERITKSEDPRIAAVGRALQENAQQEIGAWQRRERDRDVHGR